MDTTQAILHITALVQQAFKDGHYALAAFVDMEGAFDAVWRNAVLYKLHKIGIRGRLWLVIADFLSNRFSKVHVNTAESAWIPSLLGVPQGSVLAVILFLVFTCDLKNITDKSQFADDLNLIKTGTTLQALQDDINKDLEF